MRKHIFGIIRIILYTILILIFSLVPVAAVKDMSLCLFTHLFHIHCFGCGMTRAMFASFHLDFITAFEFNKGIVLIFPLFLFLVINDTYSILRRMGSSKSNQISAVEWVLKKVFFFTPY